MTQAFVLIQAGVGMASRVGRAVRAIQGVRSADSVTGLYWPARGSGAGPASGSTRIGARPRAIPRTRPLAAWRSGRRSGHSRSSSGRVSCSWGGWTLPPRTPGRCSGSRPRRCGRGSTGRGRSCGGA